MLPILFATYGAVFVAEIAGDKLLYTTGVIATRYRTVPIRYAAVGLLLFLGLLSVVETLEDAGTPSLLLNWLG